MSRLRVAVCDDVSLVRASLISFLEADADLEVVGDYATGQHLLVGLGSAPADVVLLDVRMPGFDGPAVAETLTRSHPETKVIYVSSYPDQIPVADALQGRVVGALSKDIPPDDLVRAVKLAANGTTLISPGVLHRHAGSSKPPARREEFACDDRERDVLRLLCRGYTNDQIARALNRSSSSVKQILSAMCRRAGVASRTELVLFLLDADYPSAPHS